MAHISISVEDCGSLTAISRDVHEHEDALEVYMQAFSDFLMAEGFAGDARFIEMQEQWADINQDVYVDPFAGEPKDTLDDGQLELPLGGSEFRVGDIVKCDISGADWLKEWVGKVSYIDGWTTGVAFNNGQNCGFTDGELTLLYRP